MSEFTPRFRPVVVLLFLGTGLDDGCEVALSCSTGPLSRSFFLRKTGGRRGVHDRHWNLILLGSVSFASTEKVLPAVAGNIFAKSIATRFSIIGAQNRGGAWTQRCS